MQLKGNEMRGCDEMSIYRQRGWEPFLMIPHAARQLNKAVEHSSSPSQTHYVFCLCVPLHDTTDTCLGFKFITCIGENMRCVIFSVVAVLRHFWDLWVIEIQPLNAGPAKSPLIFGNYALHCKRPFITRGYFHMHILNWKKSIELNT